jgi:coenzyme F420-reducing hydrogenase beta subunit
MSNDCNLAEFTRITNENELARLRGSKYLQAKVGDTYKQVRDDLLSGEQVLFSGTGCQVNGLNAFLGKKYDNLLCVDVICHGVPSPYLWKKYVEQKESEFSGKLIDVNFRCKDDSWSNYGMKETDEKHREVYISKDKDSYMQMFLRDYCLRPSCYECVARKIRSSDITIADFWGIENAAPEMDDGKGTSLVLVRTGKGERFFDRLTDDMVFKEVTYEDAVRSNPAEYKSPIRPSQRDTFFSDLRTLSFPDMERKYAAQLPRPFKIKLKKAIKKFILPDMKREL